MFALFYSLYYSMFTGSWNNWNIDTINANIRDPLTALGTFLTSIFGEFQYTSMGTDLGIYQIIRLICFVLALITSIGIVVMAVKGVKKAFGIFFMGVR